MHLDSSGAGEAGRGPGARGLDGLGEPSPPRAAGAVVTAAGALTQAASAAVARHPVGVPEMWTGLDVLGVIGVVQADLYGGLSRGPGGVRAVPLSRLRRRDKARARARLKNTRTR